MTLTLILVTYQAMSKYPFNADWKYQGTYFQTDIFVSQRMHYYISFIIFLIE